MSVPCLRRRSRTGLIARNPARSVRLPARLEGEVVPPTAEQVHALYDAAPDWFRIAVVIGSGLGLRQGEVSGLTADRVDWLGRSVRVDRQWATKPEPRFEPPKTAASVRTVPSSDHVLAELGRQIGRRHDGFVLHLAGEPLDSNRFGYYWRGTVKRAGLEGLRFHALRHAFASALISAGCSVKAVQKALGHASAAVTLDTYGHLWPGDEERMRNAVDVLLSRPAEDYLRTDEAVADRSTCVSAVSTTSAGTPRPPR